MINFQFGCGCKIKKNLYLKITIKLDPGCINDNRNKVNNSRQVIVLMPWYQLYSTIDVDVEYPHWKLI